MEISCSLGMMEKPGQMCVPISKEFQMGSG